MGKDLDKARKYPSDPRERARQLVKEGRIGGKRPGAGRPRKPRASEVVAEAARAHAREITKAFEAGIAERNSPATRVQAAKEWLSIEMREAELGIAQERDESERLSRDQLIEILADRLSSETITGRILHKEIQRRNSIEGVAEEISEDNLS